MDVKLVISGCEICWFLHVKLGFPGCELLLDVVFGVGIRQKLANFAWNLGFCGYFLDFVEIGVFGFWGFDWFYIFGGFGGFSLILGIFGGILDIYLISWFTMGFDVVVIKLIY